jgi:nitrilase
MTFRAAVVQAGSVLFDTPASIAKLADWTSAAVAEGASLVVFPEAFIGGYPKGFDFGARLGSRTPQGREDFARYFSSAIDVPGA